MTTTWDNLEKIGTSEGGWMFNEVNLLFNSSTDPDSGSTVYFNGFGLDTTWTNLNKV